ncbi:ABC transporter permease [Fructobacillus evanidus]|nr:ABC-type multidrug transport system [Fructobacillus sp. LMG 32999]CAK1239295.1 ABC-type multidrug transport system [Fructobacillus sp. LMG 32999]CAK1244664.1 ABC-type multidrug transport system [Fructobacillus sp. LMG 32999]CAK1245181.1 ABC-type multidrug transport system [Fructobacillus sp. LMG 32999]CAK1245517.1 ABC-type multidrug transport system [Fructobacillus sp. LMG 32999]
MFALMKRNQLLYFRNRSGVVMSLMGALISFILYIVFLKKGISSDWTGVPHKNQLLDTWLIGGTLAITGVTTTLTALSQLVKDKETHVSADLFLTDTKPIVRRAAYLLSAAVVGFLMQVAVFAVMAVYFMMVDGLSLTVENLVGLVWVMLLSAVLSTIMNALILNRIETVDNLSKVATIVGTASGFLVGGYIPIGSLPDFAQTLMKITPSFYVATLFRQVLMNKTISSSFAGQSAVIKSFDQEMGIRAQWGHLLTGLESNLVVLGLIGIGCLLLLAQVLHGGEGRTKAK